MQGKFWIELFIGSGEGFSRCIAQKGNSKTTNCLNDPKCGKRCSKKNQETLGSRSFPF